MTNIQVRLHVDALLNQTGNAALLAQDQNASRRLTNGRHRVRHVEGARID